MTFRCIILGAAGRDFHDFQTFFRTQPEFHVCAFTASQIPDIEQRVFPKSLAGDRYTDDIPIHAESKLAELIREYDVDFVFLAYSDLSYAEVMHKASIAQAAGAGFAMLGPRQTQLLSTLPVIAVTASRTGAGKSPISQYIASHLAARNVRAGILRHPMPYGRIDEQRVEHFQTMSDLDRYECTIEEREEYQPYLERGLSIFAGVDYEQILRTAEQHADVILWDGGNNDYPFVRPNQQIVVLDALRPGHETGYYPGETNLRSADIVIINKAGHAGPESIEQMRSTINRLAPKASVITGDLAIDVESPDEIRGKRVLVIEDGPTLTHGGMPSGAGLLAAQTAQAGEIIDPRPFAVGSIAATFSEWPHLDKVLPALGYSEQQRAELEETIRRADPDIIVDASPAFLQNFIRLTAPVCRVRYTFRQLAGPDLLELLNILPAR